MSKELQHMAAILHVYAVGLFFLRSKKIYYTTNFKFYTYKNWIIMIHPTLITRAAGIYEEQIRVGSAIYLATFL